MHVGMLDHSCSLSEMPPATRRLRLLAPVVVTGLIASIGATEAVDAQVEPLATPSSELVRPSASLSVRTVAEPPLGPGQTIDLTVEQGTTGRVESKSIGQGVTWILSDLAPGGVDLRRGEPPPDYEVERLRCVTDDAVVAEGANAVLLPLSLADGDAVSCTVELVGPVTPAAGATRPAEASTPAPEPVATPAPTPRPTVLLLVPKEGRWRGRNGRGQVDCGVFQRALEPSGPEFGTVTVRQNGDRIILRGLAADESRPIRADRDPEKPGRYVGTLRFTLDGITATFRFILDLESEERIKGRLVARSTVSGQQCTIRRPFELTHAPR